MQNLIIRILGIALLATASGCTTFDVLLVNGTNQSLRECSVKLAKINPRINLGDVEPYQAARSVGLWVDNEFAVEWKDQSGDKVLRTVSSPTVLQGDWKDAELIIVVQPDHTCFVTHSRLKR